ncbi:sigma-70 family RNA polymerase sigma factor [Puniceicoccales bacterium CK1056]|uniref:Sigma-70 family RNA polymerase sigma factor n=1 Tax=Oceanipulchritudo coccoides TaxID=2706888 RepID=A0A6B2LXS0_9BACT|nr:sigma-70 family RNA polymerase sigma factor [Oceanipulchritudo coccoides]NDV61421.1 sigma-70 family RNA polymerase sigma factor [Oceanipulchritudo coccoides]
MMSLAMVQTASDLYAARGKPDFSSLARQFYEPVYRFILRQAPTAEDAADLTQETFIRAQKNFGRFDPEREFAPWLFTIARRTVADFYRQRRQLHELLEDGHADPAPDPRECLDVEESVEQLWSQARKLKPKYHQVLLLHYKENLSLKQTAVAMGLTTVHVKVLLFRARSALKRHLPANTLIEEETNHE